MKIIFSSLLVAVIFIAACKKDNSPNSNSSPNIIVTTLAGSGVQGNTDGMGTAASFYFPGGIATDAAGNVYVSGNNLIRKITPAGMVSTLAGNISAGNANGIGTAASFYLPYGVAVDAVGNVYVADEWNNLIRKITSAGVVSTLAGNTLGGNTNDIGAAASFNHPGGVAVNATGNVYVTDYWNNLIRKITPTGVVSTLAGSGVEGYTNGIGTAASFNGALNIAVDAASNVYVTDEVNHLIRKISPAGVVSTLAGSGAQGQSNGTGIAASFSQPEGIAVDAAGNVYVADSGNNLIRKISPTGVVSTLAGSGAKGQTNGISTVASFNGPDGIAVDAAGSVIYVADRGNNIIRKIVVQ